MKKTTTTALTLTAVLALTACGGGGGGSTTQTPTVATGTGYYLDSAVEGIDYTCGSQSGKTDKEGKFTFEEGKECRFTLAGIPVKSIAADQLHDGVKIVEDDVKVARFLQSIDADGDPSNGITITDEVLEAMQQAVEELKQKGDIQDDKEVITDDTALEAAVTTIQSKVSDFNGTVVTQEEAQKHLKETQTDITKEYFAGKTWYLPVTDVPNKHVEKMTFKENGALYIEWEEDGKSYTSDSISYEIDGNEVHFFGQSGDGDTVDITVPILSFSDEALITKDGTFYKNKADAEAYLKSLTSGGSATSGDLSWIVGKTFYQHCDYGDQAGVATITFQNDGIVKIVEGNGYTEEVPYEIDGTTIYTTEDGHRKAHTLIERTDKYIKINDGGGTSTFYFNLEDAQSAPADECGGDDEGSDEYKVSDLVSGHVTLVDENNTALSIPSDAWIRITPSIYQVENAWYGVNCKIDSNGNFGTQCYIHKNESDMRSAFSNSNEKFQIIVYAERTGTTRWEKDEPAYGWSHGDVSNGAWHDIKISKIPL